ncbi:MAG: N-acetyl-gamma-glutamyl-phosphate reductase [Chitinophagia bacterium]|nr:N-acetyl-gamma-glutamyl-phosphate reductase [Chitinophagia bacterium]
MSTTQTTQQLIHVGIAGGAGYTGGELIRLLLHHPAVAIRFVHSNSKAGNPIASVHTDLAGETDMLFSNHLSDNIDVLFLCLGHGESKSFITANSISDSVAIIDLSQDFRWSENHLFLNRQFVYGLPELNRDGILAARNIANPGCFATAIQLGLLPLAQAGILSDVYTTAITGSTGAGQSLSSTAHFSWRANNIQAYKTLQHQHLTEIHQSLQQLQGNDGMYVHFVPWRGDFTRGIYCTSVLDGGLPLEEVKALYRTYYQSHPYTHFSEEPIHLKQVINTNKCLLHIEKEGNKLAVHSAIDNLLKGASGQAVQNMNLLFGLEETMGLQLKASAF